MMNVYIDFDNTIVECNKKVIEILNNKYQLNQTEANLCDYHYQSIKNITLEEKMAIFESDEFFEDLKLKPSFDKFIKKYHNKFNFIITTKGTMANLVKKKKWLDSDDRFKGFEFIGITNDGWSKNSVDMSNSIQIDDFVPALDTNAMIKILYKDYNNYVWQQGYENTDIIVTDTWEQIDDILDFYLKYDYKKLEEI